VARRAGMMLLLVFVATSLSAGRALAGGPASAQAAASVQAFTLDDIAWLAGSWRGSAFGGEVEEHYLPPRGGAMVGLFRLVTPGERVGFYEFILIEQAGEGVRMRLHHFNEGLTRWEERPVEFALTATGESSARFAMVQEDGSLGGPLEYTRRGDELEVEITVDAGDGPEPSAFTLRRTRSPSEHAAPAMLGRAPDTPEAGGDEWGAGVLVQMAVSDLDRAAAFYSEILGLEMELRDDALGWARFATGTDGVTIGLGVSDAVEGSGTTSVNLTVRDIHKTRARLEREGVEFRGPTLTVPGVVMLATLLDPDGNRVRLAQDLRRP